MMEFINYQTAIKFLLIISRISGLIVSSPILSERTIPGRIKILLTFVLSIMILPSLPRFDLNPSGIGQLVAWIFGQALFGMVIGFAVSLTFAALQSAGNLADVQIGFGVATLIDPSTGVQTTILARWYYLLAIMLFLGIGGHHWLILGLINSFKVIPLTQATLTAGLVHYILRSFSNIFQIAFNITTPILISVLLVDLTAGIVARISPKLNILIISFPFKIGLGLFVAMLSVPVTVYLLIMHLDKLKVPLMKFFYI